MRLLSVLLVAISLASCTGSEATSPSLPKSQDQGAAESNDTGSTSSPDLTVVEVLIACSRDFGGNDEQCPSTTLLDWPEAEALLAAGQECFFTEFKAGRDTVWDLLTYTDEGDPIYKRHLYDGENVWLLGDDRADTYGAGRISILECDGYGPTKGGLDGLNCKPSQNPGFTGFADAD